VFSDLKSSCHVVQSLARANTMLAVFFSKFCLGDFVPYMWTMRLFLLIGVLALATAFLGNLVAVLN